MLAKQLAVLCNYTLVNGVVAVAYTLAQMGASSWQTITGGRAVWLKALKVPFVTSGGTLMVAPLFSEGNFEERFRRSREVFLLFACTFSTVVGFYFASATTPFLGSSVLMLESFDSAQTEMQVAIVGGKPPHNLEVEYRPMGATKKKPPQSLETPGTITFAFSKAEDWPAPMKIRARDSADAKVEREVILQNDELLAAGFKEPSAPAIPQGETGTSQ